MALVVQDQIVGKGDRYLWKQTYLRGDRPRRGPVLVGEGSIYPLLNRLQRGGLVEPLSEASNDGPPRKYYRIADGGRRQLAGRMGEWRTLTHGVDSVINGRSNDRSGLNRCGRGRLREFLACRRDQTADRSRNEGRTGTAPDRGREGWSHPRIGGRGRHRVVRHRAGRSHRAQP